MKDLIIKNINDIKPNVVEGEGNTFSVKPVVSNEDIDTCEVAFVEIPAGNYAFGYHYHDQSEEVFYILSGRGVLRGADGEREVRAGDILCFPAGEKGAHVLSNNAEGEPLVFIDFDVRASKADLVVFPDTNKMLALGEHIKGMTDLPR